MNRADLESDSKSNIEARMLSEPEEAVDPKSSVPNKIPAPGQAKQKRTSLACIRCRTRHIRCPGGDPCKKCQLAKTKCEYVEADKKIVVSMKYLSKLHDDISRLKKDNAMLRNNLKEEETKRIKGEPGVPNQASVDNMFNPRYNPPVAQEQFAAFGNGPSQNSLPKSQYSSFSTNEVIQPSLDKHGRLVQSRTGGRVYVGSSSMTLFGLEIQNMLQSFVSTSLFPSNEETPFGLTSSIESPGSITDGNYGVQRRETEIIEKGSNIYKIYLAKTKTRPGLSIEFTLPSYAYAMLLVDTFVNYNDGCFYFFNEGLIKRYLMNLYSGKTSDNKKIMKRNTSVGGPPADENSIKQDTDDDAILETIWFCKILLIFATGEMYLGTESDPQVKTLKNNLIQAQKARNNKTKEENDEKKNSLPGATFFYQASEIFTGLFASGAIDNITKDGGVEALLLYAFYLQVADCTISSYFYFGLALRATLILGWHVDADKENLNRFELEHRRRIWWTVYMYERMLSSKAGLPLSFADASVSTELPADFDMHLDNFPSDENDVRGFYIFPPNEYIKNCVTITQINAMILSALYTKQPTVNILPVVSDLVHKLMNWKNSLPDFLKIDFSTEDMHVSRLVVNLMTEYFQGMNLAVRPLLFHFATKKLKELQFENMVNKYLDLTKYSKNVLSLLNSSFQASISTIKSIWALVPDNMVALFGWMDREYLFTSASTLILFNASFGVHDATKIHLDHALTIFTRMTKLKNYPASIRKIQLLKLISILDFNGVMNDLLIKHDEEGIYKKTGEGSQNMQHTNIPSKPMAPPDANMTPSNIRGPELRTAINPDSKTNISSDNSDFDVLQFTNSSPISGQPQGSMGGISSADGAFNMDMRGSMSGTGDVYNNSDLAGIEGLTYLDEEQQLWNEITNDAVWLNVQNHSTSTTNMSDLSNKDNTHSNSQNFDFGGTLNGLEPNQGVYGMNSLRSNSTGYSDIINQEFQDIMEE